MRVPQLTQPDVGTSGRGRPPPAGLRQPAPQHARPSAGVESRGSCCTPTPPSPHALRHQRHVGGSFATRAAAAGDGAEPAASAEESQAFWKEMLEGMGAAGAERPEDAPAPLPEDAAIEALQMGTWRLRSRVCPQIAALVAQIEGAWRSALSADLALYPMPKEFKFMDSEDPGGAGGSLAWLDRADPVDRNAPGWPRLLVENRAYSSRVFRKLHLEVAVRQDGLEVLHCVWYPRPQFDLPILSVDVVANAGRVSLALVDPCPVSPDLSLPPPYAAPVRELQARYGLETNRRVPDWGAAIFSPLCLLMRPESDADLAAFLKYTIALAQYHAQIGRIASPVASSVAQRTAQITAGHARYCAKNLENDKTRRVLEKAFGGEAAERYMREVMFDCPP